MSVQYRSYRTANTVLAITKNIGILLVIVGFIIIFLVLRESPGGNSQFAILIGIARVGGLVSALGSIIGGLLLIASSQAAQANIHTAEMTWELLTIAKGERITAPSEPNLIALTKRVQLSDYKGRKFYALEGKVILEGADGSESSEFTSYDEAKRYVDQKAT